MRCQILHLFLYGFVLISHSNAQAVEEDALEVRFREEAPRGWRRLELKHQATRFVWSETEFNNSGDEQNIHKRNGSNCYRGKNFVIRIQEPGTNKTEVWGGNERNIFTVSRKSDEDSWMLSQFASRTDDPVRNGDIEYGTQARIPWQVYNVTCCSLVADSSFKIESIGESHEGAVELRFTCSPRYDDGHPQVTSGRILLLPKRDWAISMYEAKLTRPRKPDAPPVVVAASATYGAREKAFLNLDHSTYEVRWDSNGKQRWTRWETDWTCQHCNEPPESFTLASFGLDEPALPNGENAKVGPWMWLNVAAVACLIVGILLRSRQKAGAR